MMTIDLHAIDWPETLQRFGIDAAYLTKKQGPCPMHPNQGKTKFRFANTNGSGAWICNDCGSGNGFTLLRRFTNLPDREIFRKLEELYSTGQTQPVQARSQAPWCVDELSSEEKAKRKARLQKAWKGSITVREDSPVLRYLQMRVPGLRLSWVSQWIRATTMTYFDEELRDCGSFPVMLAKAAWHDAAKRMAATLHRTYLTPDGHKAPFEKVKKQMPSHVKLDGASIRVNTAPDGDVIFVCEGIETAFAIVSMTGNRHPVYATLNAGNLVAFRVPPFARRIIICADHDELNSKGVRIGIVDARALESRLIADGKKAEVRYPETEGEDWNDYYVRHCSPEGWRAKTEQSGRRVAQEPGHAVAMRPHAERLAA
jgi:putative DNA primase/helicase